MKWPLACGDVRPALLIGRFLSVDAMAPDSATGANLNRYKYANGNPYRFTDPDGRMDRDTRSKLKEDRERMERLKARAEGMQRLQIRATSLFMLPQNEGEGGFYNYGTPPDGAGQYGAGSALSTIFLAGHRWTLNGEQNSFGVGNLSLKGGGPFPPHGSHKSGTDIDVRPMSLDGARRGGTTWRSRNYDRDATQRLVDTFRGTGRVGTIYFNDPQLTGVEPMRGHDDHIHVRVMP